MRAAVWILSLLSLYVISSRAQVTSHEPFLDVRDFGAACNGRADDSSALQNAISTGISKGEPVYIPGGVCLHKATLNMNRGPAAVRLIGTPFLSTLKYAGAGSGWLWKNGDGRQFIYNPVVLGVSFTCGNPAGCSKGFEAYTLSEGVFRDVDIAQSDGVFATAWFCSGCNIMDVDHLVMGATSKAATSAIGIDCVGCAALTIHAGDFYYFPAATLRFSGSTTHIVIDGNWFEGQDTAILFDDSASGGSISSDLISITNNRFLFNGAGGTVPRQGSFTNQVALRLNNADRNWMTMTGIIFGPGNSVFCAAGLCSTATPIVVSISPTTSVSTAVDLTVRDNTFRGASAGVVTSNSRKVDVYLENNRSRDQAGKTLKPGVIGIATTAPPE